MGQWWGRRGNMRARSVTSTLPMCWEGGWEWARLRGVALDERELDSYSYSYSSSSSYYYY